MLGTTPSWARPARSSTTALMSFIPNCHCQVTALQAALRGRLAPTVGESAYSMRIAAAMRPSRRRVSLSAWKCDWCRRPSAEFAPSGNPHGLAFPAAHPRRGSAQRTYSNRSLHGRLAHRIGMQILRGRELPAGAGLPSEDVWSAELDVSRTALREAIKVLAAKGLIESRPRTGARVCARERWNFLDPDVLAWRLAALPTERYVRDLFDLRQGHRAQRQRR